MRTKHILTALALPALFAACTADEFVNEDFGKTAERAKVSKNFSLITSEDATTRYAVDGETSLKFLFEKGDRIGAAIIDEMDPSKEDPKDWTIIPSLAGNYPFEYDGSQWNSATTLGIGHYLFVYPYDKSDNNRAAVSYSLPTVQKLYKGENGALDLNAAIEAGDKAVFSSVLYEGDTQLAAKLQGLYTYPKFVINFDNGLPITSISQVVLEYSDTQNNNIEGFEVKGGFNHEKVAKAFADAETADDEKAYWDGVQTADFLIQQGENINGKTATDYTTKAYSKYLIAKLPDNTPVKVNSITNNKYIEVRFMMPGVGQGSSAGETEYGANLKMHIYTNNGIYTIDDVWRSIDWKSTTSAEAKSKALLRGKSNTMTLKKDAPKAGTALTIVTNIADWNTLVDAYGATADQTISIVGDEFFFDSTVKMPSKAIFTVNTPVSVKGDVTLKNINATDGITVEKGAKLTTSANFTANAVVNKGAMVIAQALNDQKEVVNYNKVSEIENLGTLAVAKDAVATFELTNAKAATVENDGTMNVSGTNDGVINNNAVMNTTGFTNNAREYNTKGDKVVNEPTINNAKGAKILSVSGALTNNATIVNAGVLTCKNSSGTIANSEDDNNEPAVLDSKADAITYITDNKEGKVIVYSANTEGLTIANNKGIVEYTTVNAAESFKTSLVNTVIAATSLEVKDGALSSLTFNGDATLKLGKDATVSVLTVNKGKTTLATDLTLETLNVAQGAMAVIPEGKAMTINGTGIDNKGTILVGGTFNATQIEAGKGGLVEDNGNGEINWKKSDVEAAYKASLQEPVEYFINESTMYTGASYKVVAKDFASFVKNGDKNGRTELREAMAAAGIETVPQADLDETVEAIANGNKANFMTTVKAGTWVAQTVFYPTKVKAYDAFKGDIVKGTKATMVTSMTGNNTLFTYASFMTTTDIDALVAEKLPTMFVWENCDLDKLVALWAEYDGALSTIVDSKEYSDAKTAQSATGTDKVGLLVDWVKIVLNTTSTGNPAVGQAQAALAELGVTVTSIKKFGAYTNAQMNAVDNELLLQQD